MKTNTPAFKTRLRSVTLALCIFAFPALAHSQCDSGSEPECECGTAEILCSINELDGYSFSMSTFQHPQDGPDPLCGGSWVPNNPTWFAFIAWCEELTLTVEISNCTTVNGFFGAQVGVYTDCNGFGEVECIGNDCNNEDDKVLDMDNLTIGETYYFMIDGCLGSACDVEISVDGACTEEIADWTDTDIGPQTEMCLDEEVTHTVEELTGATDYHWYIDGNEVEVTEDPEHTIVWDTEGTYELCVDVSNDCIDVDEDPDEICETITVYGPDAGMITATPDVLCPGETSDVEVTGYNSDPEYEEVIIIVDPSGEVLDVITNGNTASVTYDECGDVTVYSLNYPNWESIDIPSIGGDYSGSDCVDQCCDETSLVISFEDDEDPMFTNAPADLTVTCFDEVPPMIDLDATDNCAADAVVSGMETDNSDMCDGGTIEREWSFSDDCGNMIQHVQMITIEPIEEPEYTNPPSDLNLDCFEMIPDPIDLSYDNGGMAGCQIMGTVSPSITGTFDLCGTTVEYEWDYTDMCGNNLNHVQVIIVAPAEAPEFINPPSDVVIDCEDDVPDPDDLDYSNGDTGSCLIEGTVSPTVEGSFDACGTTIIYTWEFTDPCGNEIEHKRFIDIIPAEEAFFIDPPADITLTCEEFDNYTFEDLDYTNNSAAPCEISGSVSPEISDETDPCGGMVEAFYEYTDDCGRTIDHRQTITVEPAAQAEFTSFPADMTVPCNAIPAPAAALSYTNGESGACAIEGDAQATIDEDFDECGGTITNTWEFEDECGRMIEHVQTITIEEAPEAEFDMFPADMTMDCSEFEAFDPELLSYTNGDTGICLIEGEIDPEADGDIDECGGVIAYLWEFTDNCGRTIEHLQLITVNPAPEAAFLNVPGDVTLDCSDVNNTPPVLNYDNGEDGICQIQGSVQGIPSGNISECGGMQTMTWTFIDNCNRFISVSQNITYLPAEDPEFQHPPEDIILDCDEELPEPEDLEYSNELDSPCEISGEVEAEVEIAENIYTYYWTYTNPCTGNMIEHTQVIEKLIPVEFEEDEFEFELCIGNELDLSDIELIDLNETLPDITYHDDLPPDSGNEIDPEIILEEENAEYYIVGTNNFGCFDIATVIITAEDPVSAGEDVEAEFCIGDELLDLFQFLEYPASFDGEFNQIDGPDDLDFIYADEINVSEAEEGIYIFQYYVESENSCPDDESIMTLELLEPVSIELLSIECAADGQSYTIVISNDDYNIEISEGDISNETDSEVTIINIPIDHDITIEIEEPQSECIASFQFIHPDCSCPMVSTPVSNGNQSICEGDAIPVLSVTVGLDETAHWYDAPIGGNLLLENSLNYQPVADAPGQYVFYVEAESTIQEECYSPLRTEIALNILPVPETIDTFLNICNYNGSGFESFTEDELTDALDLGAPNLTVEFYRTMQDLDNGMNVIEFPFTNDSLVHQQLFVLVTNGADCSSISMLDIRINAIPELDLSATDESCFGMSDGTIEPFISPVSDGNELLLGSDIVPVELISNLSPGSYSFIAIDSLNCRDSSDIVIAPGIQLEFEDLSMECFDNGTSSDPSDDYYILQTSVISKPAVPGQFSLTDQSGLIDEEHDFGDQIEIQVPANGSQLLLNASSIPENCSIEEDLGALLACSSDCVLEQISYSFQCNDNSSIYDPSDDYYDVFMNFTSTNGSATYNVFINGILVHNFTYDEDHSFTLVADGTLYSIYVADAQFNSCQLDLGDIQSIPCSDACLLEAGLSNILCDNNNTLDEEGDDTFSFELNVNPTNASDSFIVVDPPLVSAYSDVLEFNDILISTDSMQIIVVDQLDAGCSDTITVYAPAPCSDPCTNEILDLLISDCNDNGTPNDTLDDHFSVSFIITTVLGNVGSVVIDDNLGNSYGPFNYDELIELSDLPANNESIILSIYDDTNPVCILEQELIMPSCSEPCIIDIQIVEISCNDNGTLETNDDDLFSFEILIEGINVSASGFTTDLPSSGEYGQSYSFSDYPIADGDIVINVTDAEFADCQSSITIPAPNPCSQPCIMEFIQFEALSCSDNTTPTEPLDDSFSVSFNLQVINGEFAMYTVTDTDGNIYGPFEYNMDIEIGPFPADGSVITFSFTDTENTTCFLEANASQESCSDLCVLQAQVSNILCFNNDTEDSNLDDLFSFEIIVEGINNSTIFNIPELGLSANYNESLLVSDLLIQNGDIELTIVDSEDGSCMQSLNIEAPEPCSSPCEVILEQLNVLACDNNNTGDDSTDDHFSIQFVISVLDGSTSEYILSDNQSNSYGPFQYGELNEIFNLTADGSSIVFTLTDNSNAVCGLEFDVSQEECSECPQSLQLSSDISTLNCDDTVSNIFVDTDGSVTQYSWTGPDNFSADIADIQVSVSGEYEITVVYDDACVLTESIIINENYQTPGSNISFEGYLNCQDASIVLDGSQSIGIQNALFAWYDEDQNLISNDSSVEISLAGTYSLILTDSISNCISAPAEVEVEEILDMPEAVASLSTELNCENETAIIDGSNSVLNDNTLIEWTDSNGNLVSEEISFETGTPGIYFLNLTDTLSKCESNEFSIELTENTQTPTAVILANPGNIFDCVIETIELSTLAEANTIYSWIINNEEISTELSIEVSNPSQVSLIALDTISLCSDEEILQLEDFTEFPLLEISEFGPVNCELEEVCIELITSSFGQELNIFWYDSNGNIIAENTDVYCTNQVGSFSVEVVDQENNCQNSESFQLEGPEFITAELQSQIVLEIDDNYTLEPVIISGSQFIADYYWISDSELSCYDCFNPQIINFSDGDEITLVLVSETDCETMVSTRIRLQEKEVAKVYIPNVFIGGRNDNFTIYASEELEIIQEMYIFDRWGELVFTNTNFAPNDPDLGWDGTFNGKDAEQGVYVYLFVYELDGKPEKSFGDVTLLW